MYHERQYSKKCINVRLVQVCLVLSLELIEHLFIFESRFSKQINSSAVQIVYLGGIRFEFALIWRGGGGEVDAVGGMPTCFGAG
jgi:hypothetical protein